jgi:3-hydroxybutyryl-CoA dehydrogenase
MGQSVCICGAGTMGRGIAYATAARGLHTILYDINPDILVSASLFIRKELLVSVEKKHIGDEESNLLWNRILFTTSLTDCSADIIIEAVVENIEAKSELFKTLFTLNNENTIFVSNTSSLSITEIAIQTGFPDKIAGLHFFNPANRMKLVEIIQTEYTPWVVLERLKNFVLKIGKTAVVCQDSPGFIVNRVARPYYLEAMRILEEVIADVDTIDKLMESSGFKMGPFHLMDLIGNDINQTVSRSLYDALGKPERLKPSEQQEKMVSLGQLGKKTGSGFFQYN